MNVQHLLVTRVLLGAGSHVAYGRAALATQGPGILASADSPVPGGGKGTGKISAPFPDIAIGTSVSPSLPFPPTYLLCPHRSRLGVSSGA